MKQFVLWMAIVGLATTGCAQNRVLGPHARRGGADFQTAQSQRMPQENFRKAMPNFRTATNQTKNNRSEGFGQSNVDLASYGGDQCCGCDTCSGGCDDSCCGGGCCDGGGCASGGGRGSGRGCSSCGGRGCSLCQRMVGRVASGFCPHGSGYPESYNFTPSPPSGQVTYPYYTVRGPRDFLRNNPPSIGPY